MLRIVEGAPWIAVDYLNDTDRDRDVDYASVTAPGPCFVTVTITRAQKGYLLGREDRGKQGSSEVVDAVHVAAGGSHSWWSGAHGKLLRRGLAPGERLLVQGTAPFAFRWDWSDE